MLHFKKFPFSTENYSRPSLKPGSEFHRKLDEVRKMHWATKDMQNSREVRRFGLFIPGWETEEENKQTIEYLDELLIQVKQLRLDGKMDESGQKMEEATQKYSNICMCHPGFLTEQGIQALTMGDQNAAFQCFRIALENEWFSKECRKGSKLDRILHVPFRIFKTPVDEKTEAERQFLEMLPQIDAADNGLLERVFEKRRQLCDLVKYKLVEKEEFRFSMRKSYIEMLFNTVAIEGVEITVEEAFNLLKDGLQTALTKEDLENEELPKLLATTKAYAVCWERLDQCSLNLDNILQMHRLVMSAEDESQSEMGGKLRNDATTRKQNEQHMLAIIKWANEGMAQMKRGKIDPILIASSVHCFVTWLHPFTDGNGRITRCLMNYILMCAGFPPIVVPKTKKCEYFDRNMIGWRGDIRPFLRFICDCALETMDKIIRSNNCANTPTEGGSQNLINGNATEENYHHNGAEESPFSYLREMLADYSFSFSSSSADESEENLD